MCKSQALYCFVNLACSQLKFVACALENFPDDAQESLTLLLKVRFLKKISRE